MNGILLVDKPSGWTSSDVVVKLKGVLHERRIGHAGTLDPMATGLLTVFVGRATRAVQFAEAQDKRYLASLRLGMETDTLDITGAVINECEADFDIGAVRAAASGFVGAQMQLPPMYSAIKVNGRRLYDIARGGGTVERAPRPVNIYSIDVLGGAQADWQLDVRCSKGTYIRTLCADIGAALGVGGCMSALRRLEAGQFSVDSAYSLDEIIAAAEKGEAEGLLRGVDTLFASRPEYIADARQAARIRVGGSFPVPGLSDGEFRVYDENGTFLMLGRAEGEAMATVKSFFEV